MTRHLMKTGMLWMPLALGLIAGCGDQPLESRAAPLTALARLDIISGNEQTGLVGAQLGSPLVVRVVDGAGQPIENQVVNFRVTEGGGSVFAGVAMTDSEGRAQEWWTLGEEPGANVVEARAVDGGSGDKVVFATFTAQGVVNMDPPERPTNPHLQLGNVADGSFSLTATWGAVDAAASYEWTAGTNSGAWTESDTIPETSFTISVPVHDGGYWICVRSINDAGIRSAEASCNTFEAPAGSTPEEPEQPAAVASVDVSPTSPALDVGATVQLTAVPRDATGTRLSGRNVSWSSANTSIAAVSSSGLVTGRSAGSTTISATVDGVVGTTSVSVTAEEPAPPPPPSGEGLVFSDGFEEYGNGSSVRGAGNDFFHWTDATYTVVTSDRAHSGSRSLEFRYGPREPNGSSHMWAEQRFSHSGVQEYWIEYYTYIPENYQHLRESSSNNNKLFAWWGPNGYSAPGMGMYQLWAEGDNGSSSVDVARYGPNSTYAEYPGSNSHMFDASHRGTWQRIRIHLRLSDMNASNGIQRLWRGDELVLDDSGDANSADSASANRLTAGYLWGYDNGRYSEDTVFYVDDFRMYTSDPGWR